jgi:serine/threonine protein kinase/tetratricopeptide (TPR) repeat protein
MGPGDRLGHYTVVSLLGMGGMGAVYRATDTTLGRDVALKVLPPDMAADRERLERFRHEARVVAALSHPNIVTLYSVEHADGTHFLTMELVQGRTLDVLMAERPLPIDHVAEIARQIAEAVASAHNTGIVHRDLKPANVVVDDSGRAKVLDFGLAKTGPARVGADSPTVQLTRLGTLVGTPTYMSPEQVKGLDVDHRSDIFSLGVMLYEMVTGNRPFHGRSDAELASSILRDTPPPVTDARPSAPTELACVIRRCLEKEPSARIASMTEVADALRQPRDGRVPLGPSVAVLPFENLSADPDNEFFADGLAEELLNALTHIDGLRVAARTSSFSFKRTTTDIAEVGAKLNVATVLEGSVRRAGNRVRVTVKLVDVANGFQLWSERYDRAMADIFDLQDEIARAVAERFKLTLTALRSARLVKVATTSVNAYELYLRGRALLFKRGRHVAEGIDCLRRAVNLDPGFAAAWAGLADVHSVRGYWGMAPPGETMPKSLTAARRAIQLDPHLAEAHSALAVALLLWERDYVAADAAFRRCLELTPADTQGRCWYALFNLQCVQRRFEKGVAEARKALAADPLSAYATAILALTLALAGQTAEAVEEGRLATQRDPDSFVTHWSHAIVAHLHGAYEESIAAFTTAAAVSERHPFAIAYAAAVYADWGKKSDAEAMHEEALARSEGAYVPCGLLAVSAAAVGDIDLAIELVQESCDEREPGLVLLARTPYGRRLRQDPRFAEIRRRLALP